MAVKISYDQVENAERSINGLHELSCDVSDSPIANPDIVPVPIKSRSWDWWHIACLWVGMAVCIPTYMLAAGLMSSGMSYKEALLTILVGNAVVLIPMVLNAHAGTKYGIPFPVLIRTSFGVTGTHIPSVLRGLVACGWFGIQTWVGGQAIYVMVCVGWPGFVEFGGAGVKDALGINLGEFVSFLFFWALHMGIVYAGVDSIKKVENWAAPILIIVGVALGVWAWQASGGFISTLEASSHFAKPTIVASSEPDGSIAVTLDLLQNKDGAFRAKEIRVATGSSKVEASARLGVAQSLAPTPSLTIPAPNPDRFIALRAADGRNTVEVVSEVRAVGAVTGNWWLKIFLPLLTAMVGYWATLSLNIPDFSRYARSQKDQLTGQALGLPATMTGYAFVGVFATCASLVVFPDVLVAEQAPWDPVKLLARFDNPLVLLISMFGLALATISTNIAANVVAPAVGFSNLAPHKISFKMGGYITGVIGIVMMPWKLLATAGGYIFTWLIGYSALLGAIAGVMLSDYFVLRRQKIDLLELYKPEGKYRGFNWAGIIAFVLGVIPNIPGFLAYVELVPKDSVSEFFQSLYTYAWFVSFGVAFAVYLPLAKAFKVDTSTREIISTKS